MLALERAGWRCPSPDLRWRVVGRGSGICPPTCLQRLQDSSKPDKATQGGALRAILIVRTRKKDLAISQDTRRPGQASVWLSAFPGRSGRQSAGGGAARDTWCGPRASLGRRGGVKRGGASQGLEAEAPGGLERGSCGPAPAPERWPQHSPVGLARWRQRRRQPSAVCDRLSLPPCLPSSVPLHSGKCSPNRPLMGFTELEYHYNSQNAMRGSAATARSAGGEAKSGKEAVPASP